MAVLRLGHEGVSVPPNELDGNRNMNKKALRNGKL
jgi:hypothetical protein